MENIIKKYIFEEVTSLSSASICFPLSLWFSSCLFNCLLFLFFFGLHTHSILNVTLVQVPCTSMFLKIQTQVFKHMLHHPIHLKPKPYPNQETTYSHCLDSKYLSHQFFSLPFFPIKWANPIQLPLPYPLFFFCISILPILLLLMSSLSAIMSISTVSYWLFFLSSTLTILLILPNLIIFLLKNLQWLILWQKWIFHSSLSFNPILLYHPYFLCECPAVDLIL